MENKMHPDDVEKETYDIDTIKENCGYYENGTMEVNAGYHCKHPQNEYEELDSEGNVIKCCYNFACPFGYVPDHDDKSFILFDDERFWKSNK